MEVRQLQTQSVSLSALGELADLAPHLVLAFGAVRHFTDPTFLASLKEAFPGAILAGCTTAGEIGSQGVSDDGAVVTAVRFRHPALRLAISDFAGIEDSRGAGERLAGQLVAEHEGEALHHILVFGQGVNINGSALIEGLASVAGPAVVISGGLAGDGGAFRQTWVLSDDGVSDRQIVAIGFYKRIFWC